MCPQEVDVLPRRTSRASRTPRARRTPRTRRALLAAASLTAAVLALGACDSGSASTPKSAGTSGPSVIAPGKPGEAAETLSAADAAKRRGEDDSPNTADLAYARMMIEH